MCGSRCEKETISLDKYRSSRIATTVDMEDIVNGFSDALTTACYKSFKRGKAFTKINKPKNVSWWREYLTIARKRVNALRRKYQRQKKRLPT
jgi:hypothetical protein